MPTGLTPRCWVSAQAGGGGAEHVSVSLHLCDLGSMSFLLIAGETEACPMDTPPPRPRRCPHQQVQWFLWAELGRPGWAMAWGWPQPQLVLMAAVGPSKWAFPQSRCGHGQLGGAAGGSTRPSLRASLGGGPLGHTPAGPIRSQAQSPGMSTPRAHHLAPGALGSLLHAERLCTVYNTPTASSQANIVSPSPPPLRPPACV